MQRMRQGKYTQKVKMWPIEDGKMVASHRSRHPRLTATERAADTGHQKQIKDILSVTHSHKECIYIHFHNFKHYFTNNRSEAERTYINFLSGTHPVSRRSIQTLSTEFICLDRIFCLTCPNLSQRFTVWIHQVKAGKHGKRKY